MQDSARFQKNRRHQHKKDRIAPHPDHIRHDRFSSQESSESLEEKRPTVKNTMSEKIQTIRMRHVHEPEGEHDLSAEAVKQDKLSIGAVSTYTDQSERYTLLIREP